MADYRGKASRVAALRAALAGRNARRDGLAVTDCPHDPRDNGVGAFFARYWVMGWNRSTPSV